MLKMEPNIVWKMSSGHGRTFSGDGYDVRLYYKASAEGKKAKLDIIFGRTGSLVQNYSGALVSSLSAQPTIIYLKFVDNDVEGSYKISTCGKGGVRIQLTLEPDEEMVYRANWADNAEHSLYHDENGLYYIKAEEQE